jgi:nucleotide-binding universal stress UspA family protein
MSDDGGRPVLVAVGTDRNGPALEWAAAEASARRCPLHIVHAERPLWIVDAFGLIPVVDFSADRIATEGLLRQAVGRARSVAPDIEISAEGVLGPTVPLLVARARGAQLLVLGSRAGPFPRRPARRLCPSVGDRVADRAPCPVAIIRGLRRGPWTGSSPRVVVGVHGSPLRPATLQVAFSAAKQRGIGLTAVHAWTSDAPADHEAVCGPA